MDADGHSLTVASAGHIAPLLIDGDDSRFVDLDPGVPIGVPRHSQYQETTVAVRQNTTLLAFTDGLVERRGEVLDTGLARLRDVATELQLSLEDMLTKLVGDLATEEHHDDTAMVGIRWEQ